MAYIHLCAYIAVSLGDAVKKATYPSCRDQLVKTGDSPSRLRARPLREFCLFVAKHKTDHHLQDSYPAKHPQPAGIDLCGLSSSGKPGNFTNRRIQRERSHSSKLQCILTPHRSTPPSPHQHRPAVPPTPSRTANNHRSSVN